MYQQRQSGYDDMRRYGYAVRQSGGGGYSSGGGRGDYRNEMGNEGGRADYRGEMGSRPPPPSYDRARNIIQAPFNQQRPAVFDSGNGWPGKDVIGSKSNVQQQEIVLHTEVSKDVTKPVGNVANGCANGVEVNLKVSEHRITDRGDDVRPSARTYEDFEMELAIVDHENGVSLAGDDDSSGDEEEEQLNARRQPAASSGGKEGKQQNSGAPRSSKPQQQSSGQDNRVQRFSDAADMVLKLIDAVLGSAVWDDKEDEVSNVTTKDNPGDRPSTARQQQQQPYPERDRRYTDDRDYRRRASDERDRQVTSYGDVDRRRYDEERGWNDGRGKAGDYGYRGQGEGYYGGGGRYPPPPLGRRVSALDEAKERFGDTDPDERLAEYNGDRYTDDRRYGDRYCGPASRPSANRQRPSDIDDEDLRRYRGGGPGPAAGGPGQGQGRGDERNEKLSRLLKTMVNSGWFHGYGVVMDDLQQKTLMRADPDSDDQRRSRQRQAWETDVENTWRTMRDKRRGRIPLDRGLDPDLENNHFRRGMSRELAVEVLRRAELGSFIIRDCTVEYGCYALSIKTLPVKDPRAVAHYLVIPAAGKRVRIKDFDREWSSMTSLVRYLVDELPSDRELCQFLGISPTELRYARQGTRLRD